MRMFLALIVLVSTSFAEAGPRSYRKCRIFNGDVLSCGSWYNGQAVVFHDGAYRDCRISNGDVLNCNRFSGTAVAFSSNAYRECKIVGGDISSCGSWYKGEAVILTDK